MTKPENILIGPDGRVTLTDFGVAARMGSHRLTLDHLTDVVGTPDYMAPEQVRGERGDARTDVYALGVLLYELLTGVVPYPTGEGRRAQRKDRTAPPLVRIGALTRRRVWKSLSIARYVEGPPNATSPWPHCAAICVTWTMCICQANTNQTFTADATWRSSPVVHHRSASWRRSRVCWWLAGFAAELLHRGSASP